MPDPSPAGLGPRPTEASAPASVFPLPGPPAAGPQPVATVDAGADWGLRAVSAALDSLVRMVGVSLLLGLGALGFLVSDDVGGVTLLVAMGMAFVFLFAYAPVLMTRERQTVGNRVKGIRVVRADGTRLSGGRAFVREVLVKYVLIELVGSVLTLYVLPLLNYLWPLWDGRGQALHDKIVDTVTVRV